MNPVLSRREFLKTTTAAAAGLALAPQLARAAPSSPGQPFSFVLLGDLHYDKLEHHDMAWVRQDKPNDVRQIENYSQITRDVMPGLFDRVRATIATLNQSPATRVAFVLQAGDLVEGLCGNEELSVRQNTEALAFLRGARLGVPLLFTKGNHDITGPGAVAAFTGVFHPFLTEQVRALTPGAAELKNTSYTVDRGNVQFAFFDAYESARSLEWFEAVAARRTAEHFFVIVHPPVVPYGARANWHVFAHPKEASRREKFLALLGGQQALVIGGHIHKYNSLARTAGQGRFAQFALSSVLSAPAAQPKDVLTGVAAYNPDQIKVEPTFSPANEAERRAIYEVERPFVRAFEYADLPGYAVVTVDGARVTVKMFAGSGTALWRTVDLTALARG